MSPKDFHSSRSANPPDEQEMSRLLTRCGISLAPGQLQQLWSYHQLLREHNADLNLTRIHNFSNMVIKLYADSILPGHLMELPSPMLDLGTGPGMPGIPLKIAFPQLEVLLAESRKKRVAFLEIVARTLKLKRLHIIGAGITPDFQQPVSGVITRAVESIETTLERISGCLSVQGLAIFMKGPHCDAEIEAASARFSGEYRLLEDRPYRIAGTTHDRRLVVYQRLLQSQHERKVSAAARHVSRKIESEHNEIFKNLKKLLASRGIKKQQRALVSGPKQIGEILGEFPERCEAWISSGDRSPPPDHAPRQLDWYQLDAALFAALDIFGTHSPLLLVRTQPMQDWVPEMGLEEGCSLLVPFQDPENVGAVIRSAVAFGVNRVILLSESAHPCHPKALRASGGAVLRAVLFQGPSINALPRDLPLVTLSAEGRAISGFVFPRTFGLLPGMEGSGLPEHLRRNAVSIPISPRVESLNAATAAAIALYLWSQSVSSTS